MIMSIQSLYNELEATRVSWSSLNDLLVQGKYDFSRQRPLLEQQSMDVFRRRVDLVLESMFALRPKDDADIGYLVIGARSAELRGHVQNFLRHAESTLSQIRSQWREGASIKDGNDSFLWQLFDGTSNYANVDVTGNFQQMHPSLNFLVGAVGSMLALCSASSVGDLSVRAEALGSAVRDAEAFRRQAEKMAKSADSSASRASEQEKTVQGILTQAETALSKLRELQTQANTDLGAVTNLVEQIKTVGANSEKLDALVSSYMSKFEAFQKELDARNQEFQKFQTDSQRAQAENQAREKEIDRLTAHADAMISGATTAGLANSLEMTRKRYEERMNSARRGFQLSVAFLVVSAVPLAAHLLPGIFGDWFPKVAEANHTSWYGVLGKVLLMVPATWLTGFYTKSFADFFHLEREYAHKAALAMSVDGFKRQAPKYEEEITAEVFLEIRNNPAKGAKVEPASHPLYDVLSKAVDKVLKKDKE
jgi:uncharacterized protein YoxC